MIKNVKISIFLIVVSYLGSTAIMATAARSAGMGINQANSWAVEGQLPYIYTNPAAMGGFGSMIYGETTGTSATSNGGFLFQPVTNLNIGFFLGQGMDRRALNQIHGNHARV